MIFHTREFYISILTKDERQSGCRFLLSVEFAASIPPPSVTYALSADGIFESTFTVHLNHFRPSVCKLLWAVITAANVSIFGGRADTKSLRHFGKSGSTSFSKASCDAKKPDSV